MTEICEICELEIEPATRVEHHISYFPENKIPLHRKCHSWLHHTKDPKFDKLRPPLGESHRYYGGMTQIRIRISTLDNILKIGKKGDSYNDVIDRLIDDALNPRPDLVL